jgi:NADH:ubiquinone oxidoreductase subunit 5 (subunit L)/multisubunit Na+/H+ antiporter MnhA subunit
MIVYNFILRFSIILIFLIPLISFLFLGANLVFKNKWDERFVYRYARATLYLTLFTLIITAIKFFQNDGKAMYEVFRPWFHLPGYAFELQFQFDYLSLVYCLLTSVLSIVISKFSSTYLLGERGFHRFFLLMLLFNAGNMLIILAGTIDLVIIGWEWVGFTSVLLISFFTNRNFPVKNSMYAFVSYRICDVFLLMAAILFHNVYHDTSFGHIFQGSSWPELSLTTNHGTSLGSFFIGLFLIGASLAKSSQFPMCGWLSKAMEGPTPSSAIFYGGISIHLGCFLLLRNAPFIYSHSSLMILLFIIGAITAIYGTMVGRTRADTKTTLAYASMTQVGIIMMEIALGLEKTALVHIFSHAIIRTFQFLRSSSLMQDFLDNPLIYENSVVKTGVQYEKVFGEKLQKFLYYFSLDGFYLDTFITRFILNPIFRLSNLLNQFEEKYCGSLNRNKEEKKEE